MGRLCVVIAILVPAVKAYISFMRSTACVEDKQNSNNVISEQKQCIG